MAEIKVQADSGGGTVSWKGPSSTTGNAAVQLTLPVDDGSADQYLKTNGSGVLSWSTVSTDPTTTSGTNNFTVADGNLVIGTAGHGIDFSANTQSAVSGASMSSELLDWYEEGSWDPTWYGSSTAGTSSYSAQVGEYTRIGRLVLCTFMLAVSNSGGGGDVTIGGFPFATKADDQDVSGAAIQYNSLTGGMPSNTNTAFIRIISNAAVATVRCNQDGSGGHANWTITTQTGVSYARAMVIYQTA